MPRKPDSDTFHVTPDGAVVVDTEKLLRKEHIQRWMRDIQQKTRFVPKSPDENKPK
jgi:hypothetical protein